MSLYLGMREITGLTSSLAARAVYPQATQVILTSELGTHQELLSLAIADHMRGVLFLDRSDLAWIGELKLLADRLTRWGSLKEDAQREMAAPSRRANLSYLNPVTLADISGRPGPLTLTQTLFGWPSVFEHLRDMLNADTVSAHSSGFIGTYAELSRVVKCLSPDGAIADSWFALSRQRQPIVPHMIMAEWRLHHPDWANDPRHEGLADSPMHAARHFIAACAGFFTAGDLPSFAAAVLADQARRRIGTTLDYGAPLHQQWPVLYDRDPVTNPGGVDGY